MSRVSPINDTSMLYVAGGTHKQDARQRQEWHRYLQGLIVSVDLNSGEVRTCASHVSPPEACADEDPAVTFKAGTIVGDRFLACTMTEVLVYSLPDFRQVGYISKPFFNDCHHVSLLENGNLIVVSTGLDMVFELTEQGDVVREWCVLEEEPWTRFSRDIDYRKVPSTKPHQSHPNYSFLLGGDLWVTRLRQRDSVRLTFTNSDMALRRIPIGDEGVHDGMLRDGKIYFTTVDGTVVVVDAQSGEVLQTHRLAEILRTDHPLGWCRGVELLDKDIVVVGFSRLRATKFEHNLRWVKHTLGRGTFGLFPTRVAAFDLAKGEQLWEVNLERTGVNSLFSIHPADSDGHPIPGFGQSGDSRLLPGSGVNASHPRNAGRVLSDALDP